jgi:uncharacterized repeat protein (TIGR02543 family)
MSKSIYAAAAVLLLLAMGCDTMTRPETGSHQKGKAAVSLAIAGTESRTVQPSGATLENVQAWRLQGVRMIGREILSQFTTELFSDPAGQTLYLDTGAWDFTLEGYTDGSGDTLILRGTLNQELTLAGPNVLRFTVEPVSAGFWTVRIAIELPPGHGINRVDVVKDGEPELDPPILFEGADSIVFEQIDHEAGDYYYSFRLYKAEAMGQPELYGVVSELVSVRLNLTSAKTYELKQDDLNLSYLIAFDLDGGDFAADVEAPEYYRHTDAAIVLPPPVRLGYTFAGWRDAAGAEGKLVTEIPALSVGNKDFYAKWSLDTYDIHYELYDGHNNSGNPATYTIIELPLTLLDPFHATREFQGWYTDPGFNEADVVTEIPAGSVGHKTFYARWKPPATVGITLQPQPGDPVLSDVPIFVGDTPIFTAGDYETYQWYWDGESPGEATGPSYTLTGEEAAGKHELAVVVSDGSGEELSARCRVTISVKAKEGDPE